MQPNSFRDPITHAAAILVEEGAREVYVFGSHCRGTASESADLDLAVLGLPADRYIRAAGRVLAETSRMADLLDADREIEFVNYLRSKGELRRVA